MHFDCFSAIYWLFPLFWISGNRKRVKQHWAQKWNALFSFICTITTRRVTERNVKSGRCGLTVPWRDSGRPGCRSPWASPGWWSSPDRCCLSDRRSAASCLDKRDGRTQGHAQVFFHRFLTNGAVWATVNRELTAFSVRLRVLVEMLNTTRVEGAWTAQNTVDLSNQTDRERSATYCLKCRVLTWIGSWHVHVTIRTKED